MERCYSAGTYSTAEVRAPRVDAFAAQEMSMSGSSIGRGPAHGGNENHDGDPTHKTLGEAVPNDEAPAGNDLLDEAAPEVPAGVKGGAAKPGIAKGPQSYPDGPNVEDSPWELEAARGNLPEGN
jgi:hypothetical protein